MHWSLKASTTISLLFNLLKTKLFIVLALSFITACGLNKNIPIASLVQIRGKTSRRSSHEVLFLTFKRCSREVSDIWGFYKCLHVHSWNTVAQQSTPVSAGAFCTELTETTHFDAVIRNIGAPRGSVLHIFTPDISGFPPQLWFLLPSEVLWWVHFWMHQHKTYGESHHTAKRWCYTRNGRPPVQGKDVGSVDSCKSMKD